MWKFVSAVITSPLFTGLCPGHDRTVLRRTRRPHLPGSLLFCHCPHVQLNRLQRASHLAGQEVNHAPSPQLATPHSYFQAVFAWTAVVYSEELFKSRRLSISHGRVTSAGLCLDSRHEGGRQLFLLNLHRYNNTLFVCCSKTGCLPLGCVQIAPAASSNRLLPVIPTNCADLA